MGVYQCYYGYMCKLAELFSDRGNQHDFTSLIRQLSPPGELLGDKTFDFQFVTVEKPYESYTGTNVQLR